MGRLSRFLPSPGSGVKSDVRGRLPWYRDDWHEGFRQGFRILAPATYIFCASAIPALAFGEQIADETEGVLTGVQVLTATAATGIMQAVLGGQPLLIVGVAEPIVLMYKYMYDFAKGQDGLGKELFLAWAAWTCVFTAAFVLLLALLNSCRYIDKFTRFAGELFGMLIAVLFMQQAIKGVRQEFLPPHLAEGQDPGPASDYQWRLVNGLWGLFLSFGFVISSLLVRTARSWRFFNMPLRGLLADYGVPALILVWTGISYAVRGTPKGVPRRLLIPNTWDVKDTWLVARDMGSVQGQHIAMSLVPAAIIALLFYFDHNVSSQLAQQAEFNLKKPPSYHWDFFLLGLMTVLCGLLGLPPVNGVLPQSPMHSKALSSIQKTRKKSKKKKKSQRNGLPPLAASGSHVGVQLAATNAGAGVNGAAVPPLPENVESLVREDSPMAGVDSGMGDDDLQGQCSRGGVSITPAGSCTTLLHPSASQQALVGSTGSGQGGSVKGGAAGAGGVDQDEVVPLKVSEQRVSGLLQSLAVAGCLGATPALQFIPSSVLWGYFAFMAIESLPGSQFWERLLLLATDPSRRYMALEKGHHPYLEVVPLKVIVVFTLFQLVYMLGVYGLTWAGIAGSLFPIPIMLLVPIRQYLMPRFFRPEYLRELDAMEEEMAPPLTHEQAVQEAIDRGMGAPMDSQADLRGRIEQEVARFRVVHHVPRHSVELRRRSRLSTLSGDSTAGGEGGVAGAGMPGGPLPYTTPPPNSHMHDV